jgi:archaemetzincin
MKAIQLLPIGNAESGIVRELIFPLQKTFRADVVLTSGSVPLQRFYDPDRGQYNSTLILQYIQNAFAKGRPFDEKSETIYLAIAASDLFIPILTYVFGEAELGGRVAVASYYRLRNELYGLPPNRPLLIRRLIKESVHELGHTFGLVHCLSQECVMHASTYVEDIDLKGEGFCKECERLLRANAGRS